MDIVAGTLAADSNTTVSGSFFTLMRLRHGQAVLNLLKEYARNVNKLGRLSARKFFLLKCRQNNVYPKHIINNVRCLNQSIETNTPFTNEIENMTKCFKKRILNLEIRIAYWCHDNTSQINRGIENKIRHIPEFGDFIETQKSYYTNSYKNARTYVS